MPLRFLASTRAIVGEGSNEVIGSNDPTARAEVVALREACQRLGSTLLEGSKIYINCEHCPMRPASIYWARPDRPFFANNRANAARIRFIDTFVFDEVAKPVENRSPSLIHLPSAEAGSIFQEWRNKEDKIP